MADRMIRDYGSALLLENDAIAKDFIAYAISREAGIDFWNLYIDESYDSSADYAKRIKNRSRTGRVGVKPTRDNVWADDPYTDLLFGGPLALARCLSLVGEDDMVLTAQKPDETEDSLKALLFLTSFGFAAVNAGGGTGITKGASKAIDLIYGMMLPDPENAIDMVLETADIAGVVRKMLHDEPEEYRNWHTEPLRDKKIFGLAEEVGIDLSVEYTSDIDERYWDIVEQQMVERYLWLGNKIFNDRITDPDHLKTLYYGGYVYEYDPELDVSQYKRMPGFIDKELKRFYGMADHSAYKSSFFEEYVRTFKEANLLLQYSRSLAPNNWSLNRIISVNDARSMLADNRTNIMDRVTNWSSKQQELFIHYGYDY